MIATIARWISLVGGIALLTLGTIGGVLNLLIFSHRTLRSCSCSWYMLIAAAFDLFTLDHALLLRILSYGFAIDAVSIDNAYCKLRFYTGQMGTFVPITLICLASIDRWASTCRSVRKRQWSSIRIARYSIVITVLVWLILSFPNLIVYQIVNKTCTQTSITYSNYLAFFLNPVLYGLLPIGVLASFSYATYLNVHQITNRQRQNRGKIEEQLTKAVILQCASFILSNVPYTLWNLYLTCTRYQIKSQFRSDLETLFSQLTILLFYFNYVSTFYINLAASNHIRKLTRLYLFKLIGQNVSIDNRVYPFTNTLSRSNQNTRK